MSGLLSSIAGAFRAPGPRQPRYIGAEDAALIDGWLMGGDDKGAFSLDQLMELAGLSVAQAVAKLYPLGPKLDKDPNGVKQKRTNERVLVCCGPGNQGGDGLVAARHLYHFGYSPSVFYPKNTPSAPQRLKKQCENLGLPLIAPPSSGASSFPMAPDAQDVAFRRAIENTDVVLDCVFGFSFKPPARAPFKTVLDELAKTSKPVLSVDIPSGWDVDEGDRDKTGFTPDALLSLTAPKKGVRAFVESGGKQCVSLSLVFHLARTDSRVCALPSAASSAGASSPSAFPPPPPLPSREHEHTADPRAPPRRAAPSPTSSSSTCQSTRPTGAKLSTLRGARSEASVRLARGA
ncbi:YjeF N-terminal domain-containing protein [Rhodotorula diobovata]|uniref:NAD(P)H-hydrate epimerase n=1 Tax=Rhodotorula diobovata TaxID=5288 RepID=A0A5C5FXD0_9BASI|nr:YjeF N-terminal domain-containing protein [Rhodotorula diobovata]